MAGFEMCPACAAEYEKPGDRRFHAQPIACRECGPRVSLVDNQGRDLEGDPILGAVWRLAEGQVLAIKGLGGFHLAVRADDESAIARLRKLKNRDYKPFAVMVASVEKARRVVELTERAAEVMRSAACPIVLARRRGEQVLARGIAPQNHRLGVMLPYTPIHHLLFNRGAGWWWALVMTSGNVSDEPIVTENADAVARLGGMCDAILWHDRTIERGVEDSVLIEMGEEEMLPVRRSRGYVPMAVELTTGDSTTKSPRHQGEKGEDGLCVGGELKNVVGVVRGGRVILSQHLGDLTDVRALEHFGKAIADMQALFGVKPAWVAHDLHPMYVSTQEAKKIAARLRVEAIGVQHHHAHAAACMAEHGETGPVLAVVCDGTGYGTDGTIWGGELLQADLLGFERLARLRPLLLAGGDAAAKDARRCALSLLVQAFGARALRHPTAVRLYPDEAERQMLVQMIRDGVNCAASSGAGRWFDGVAGILGLATHNHFEAQAALALEGAAARAHAGPPGGTVLFDVRSGPVPEIDFTRLVRELVARMEMRLSVEDAAGLFHEQFARAWYTVVREAAERTGIRTVVLSGGVFCNQRLTRRLVDLLEMRDLRVLRHRVVPPNDGGLALGQAAVAAARMNSRVGD